MISIAQNFTFGWLVIFSNKTGQISTIWVLKCVFHGKYGVHLVILGTIGLCPEFYLFNYQRFLSIVLTFCHF
jgi:hypothetical protein